MKQIKLYTLITLLFISVNESFGQFTFGGSASLGIAQVEKDNLRGFNKFVYDIGLVGGYAISDSKSILMEFRYGAIGSNRKGESVSNNKNRLLTEMEIKTVNIFLGYSFSMGDSWDKKSNFRFTTGIKFHTVVDSDIVSYTKEELIIAEDPFQWQFVALKVGPGVKINDHLFFDLYYEHSILNLKYESSVTELNDFFPFQLNFALSYYI